MQYVLTHWTKSRRLLTDSIASVKSLSKPVSESITSPSHNSTPSLHYFYHSIWISKWTLFTNHIVETHPGCQEALAPLQQILYTPADVDCQQAQSIFTQAGMMQGTTLAYTAMVLWGDHPPPLPIIEDDLQDDHGALIGPPVMNTITLAATIGMPFSLNWWFIWILMLCLSERNYPKYLVDLAASIDQPQLPKLIRWILYQQLNLSDDSDVTSAPLSDFPEFNGYVFMYHSAIMQFYALSDLCGVGGMYHQYIHSTPLWQGKYPHHDTIFITTDSEHDGFLSMCIGRVHLFFLLVHKGLYYPCGLVHWFVPVSELVHDKVGQWVVELEYLDSVPTSNSRDNSTLQNMEFEPCQD